MDMFFKYVPTKPNQTKHGELNNSIVVCLGKVLRITSWKEKAPWLAAPPGQQQQKSKVYTCQWTK